VHIQFFHEPRAVGGRGFYADSELPSDLLCRLALSNELQHLSFPRTEARRNGLESTPICLDDGLRYFRAKVSHALRHLTDSLDQFLSGFVF